MKEINVLKNFKASPNGYLIKEYIKGSTDTISDELFTKLKAEGLFQEVKKEVVEKKVAKPNYIKKVMTGNYSKKETKNKK